MEEIKIWAVDGKQASPVEPVDRIRLESDFEDILANKPELLMQELRLVGRQTPTEGGPLDLLGIDGDGRLVVFELKRGRLTRDAVAQVIDYASALNLMNDDELSQHIADRSGQSGIQEIEDFREWYSETIGDDSLDALRPMRMFLVGLGSDAATERMVKFLADNSSMDISLLTFHGFDHGGQILLARQMRVEGGSPSDEPRPPRRVNREANQKWLIARAEQYGITELFDEVNQYFTRLWGGASRRARRSGWAFRLRGLLPSGQPRTRVYAQIQPRRGWVRVVFYPRAVDLCPEPFREAADKIPFETTPQDRKDEPLEKPGTFIKFTLTPENWHTHNETLEVLTSAVYEAVQSRFQGESLDDVDVFEDEDDDYE